MKHCMIAPLYRRYLESTQEYCRIFVEVADSGFFEDLKKIAPEATFDGLSSHHSLILGPVEPSLASEENRLDVNEILLDIETSNGAIAVFTLNYEDLAEIFRSSFVEKHHVKAVHVVNLNDISGIRPNEIVIHAEGEILDVERIMKKILETVPVENLKFLDMDVSKDGKSIEISSFPTSTYEPPAGIFHDDREIMEVYEKASKSLGDIIEILKREKKSLQIEISELEEEFVYADYEIEDGTILFMAAIHHIGKEILEPAGYEPVLPKIMKRKKKEISLL